MKFLPIRKIKIEKKIPPKTVSTENIYIKCRISKIFLKINAHSNRHDSNNNFVIYCQKKVACKKLLKKKIRNEGV